ncbi:hypothetical protein CcaCcLH18_04396 [Colletotrichum camelliae]|nr:hypothetical protein CcaCcLH18_04396 [Colletotrichum camelliae]
MHDHVLTTPVNVLPPMLHSEEAQCPDDDWTGLCDRAERRKRQNRLNVRAHRKKKALEALQKQKDQPKDDGDFSWERAVKTTSSAPSIQILQWNPLAKSYQRKLEEQSKSSENESEIADGEDLQAMVRPSRRRPSSSKLRAKSKFLGTIPPYYRNPANWFPLYRDHLIPLVYYNVFRATITNIHILSLTSLLESPCTPDLHTTPLFPAPSSIPPTLLPTALQNSTVHESWIDIFPSGGMRDNAIRYRDTFDHHEMCIDLVGCSESTQCSDQPGIIAWSDPWHPDGWEVTEKFVRKWGFLLKGCEDVMRATNRWREMRDEEPLVWELE